MATKPATGRLWTQPDLKDISLSGGLVRDRHTINLKFLLDRPLDGLLFPFRDAAGLGPREPSERCFGVGYGEFCAAWLIASSHACRMTGDSRLRQRLDEALDGLVACAAASGKDWLPVGNATYPPYFTTGMLLHGLNEAHRVTRRADVHHLLYGMAQHTIDSLNAMGERRAQRVVRGEYPWSDEGNGLCEILSLLGRRDALGIVDGRSMRDQLARNEDTLQYRHANAAIMLIMGWPAAHELTGEMTYLQAFRNSWPMILSRTYPTGGSCDQYGDGDWEAWPAANSVRFIRYTQETCTAFHWMRHCAVMLAYTRDGRYADMIERVVYNKLLVAQQPNGFIRYWTDMRDYAQLDDASGQFTCCTGSGVRSIALLPRLIYSLDGSGCIVNLFVNSSIRFRIQGVSVRIQQETEYPKTGIITFSIACPKSCRFRLRMRVPGWVSDPVNWWLNDKRLGIDTQAGTYCDVDREWHDGDRLMLELPMSLRTEAYRNASGHHCVLYGPLVLAATDSQMLTLVGDPKRPDRWLHRDHGDGLGFTTVGQWANCHFEPYLGLPIGAHHNLHFHILRSFPLGTPATVGEQGATFAWPPLER